MSKGKVNIVLDQKLLCYGIISALPDYTLMSLINKSTSLNFKAIEDWMVDDSSERLVKRFGRFVDVAGEDSPAALCIANKDYHHLLFKKIKDADFILCLEEENQSCVDQIKTIPGVILCYPINVKLMAGIELIWELSIET